MDAIGAPAPEPGDEVFAAIVADIDGAAIEKAATATDPEPAPGPPETATQPPAPNPNTPETVRDSPIPDPAETMPQPPATAPEDNQERSTALVPVAPAAPSTPPPPPVPAPPPPPPPPDMLAPPKAPELVIPPKPHRPETGVVNWWAKAFPHIVWLSVIAGLAGQIFGFAEFFGGTAIAWTIAVVLGGTFEFMMVACSSRGLRAIGLNRSRKEVAPFLLLGTAAAGFAAYMNVNHFEGWLGLAAGVVSGLGYAAHVFSHLYEELEHRKEFKNWEREKIAVQREIKERAARERMRYETFQAELAEQRREATRRAVKPPMAITSGTSTPPPALPRSSTANPTTSKKSGSKTPGKATKDEAVRIGVEQKAATPARLRDALLAAGYALPSSSTTVENWCREIKVQLSEAN